MNLRSENSLYTKRYHEVKVIFRSESKIFATIRSLGKVTRFSSEDTIFIHWNLESPEKL